jgi:hypothetical protein
VVVQIILDSMEGKALASIKKRCHRLCEWHIEKNSLKKIFHLLQQVDFKRYFNKLFWNCESESDFHLTWQKMIDEFSVEDND